MAVPTHLADKACHLPELFLVGFRPTESELDDLDLASEPSPLDGKLFGIASGRSLDEILQRRERRRDECAALRLFAESV